MPSKRLEIFCQMSSLATWMTDHRDRESAEYVEAYNEMNRLRGELCRAQGVAEQDISSDGYDISQRAYQSVRASWVYNLTQMDGFKYVEGAREAHAKWIERRPDLAEGDDWLAGLVIPGWDGSR